MSFMYKQFLLKKKEKKLHYFGKFKVLVVDVKELNCKFAGKLYG